MKKRILPALLALCMVMSLLPAVAFAEGETATPATPATTVRYISCKAALALGETPDGTNPHGSNECKCSTCKCVEVTTAPKASSSGSTSGDNVQATTSVQTETAVETETTYKYIGKLCEDCMKNASCNPCEVEGCTKAGGHLDAHSGSNCTMDTRCPASVHTGTATEKCPMQCTYKVDADSETGAQAFNCTKTVKAGSTYCAQHAADPKINPCEKSEQGCTLPKGHTEKHNGTECTKDTRCNVSEGHAKWASEEDTGCPMRCTALDGKDHAGTPEYTGTETSNQSSSSSGEMCTLTKGHGGVHNNEKCIGTATCGAKGSHVAPVAATESEAAVKGCPNYNGVCGVGGCELEAGHTGDHENEVCLGAKDDGRCGADSHITGCSKKCTCTAEGGHLATDESGKKERCTGKPGCPVCADDEACTCTVCKLPIGPASGAVTDNEGNEVDTTEPTPPSVVDVPVKAEDFTDIDAEDASQEWLVKAVQTMLDNGWMQGVGASKFDAGTDASTGMVLTVVARMAGEDITGASYAQLAKAWADENDLTEGIDLESDTIARKDIILLLWRLAGKTDSAKELEFTDVEGLEGDYLTAMKWAVEKGIVMGNGDGTVTPNGILTRGQLAALVARYADNVK